MSKPSQLKAVEQLDNDARAALRSAIEQHQSAVEQHARIAAAAEHANATVVSCFSAVEQAETAFKESQANTDAHLAARALGEDDGTSIVDAEVELARKQNDLETARRTRDALKAKKWSVSAPRLSRPSAR